MLRRILFAFIILGAAAAAFIAAQRWSMERANRTVELTVEYPELRQLSSLFRVPISDLLGRFKEAGVTSVALQEQTTHQLVDEGQVFRPDPFTDQRVRDLIGGSGETTITRTVLAFPDDTLRQRVEQNLDQRWGRDRLHRATLGSMPALVVDGNYGQFRDLGVGLDPAAQAEVQGASLALIARVKNYAGLTADQLQWLVSDLKSNGAHGVIFLGDDVLGNPNLINLTAAALRQADLPYGYVELGKQHGEDKLAEATDGEFIRVHTIQGAEFSNMTPATAADRYVKAVRERNIRICYIHLLSSITGSSLEGDEDFIRHIARGIHNGGYETGVAAPYRAWAALLPLVALVALGLVAAVALLLDLLGCLSAATAGLLGLLIAVFLCGLALARIPAEQGLAFLAALVFPTLSLLMARLPTEESGPDMTSPIPNPDHPRAALYGLAGMLRISLLSLLGALYIIAFLSSTLFMTKTDQFLGIKPAIVLPVLAVFVIYWGHLLDPAPLPLRWARLKRQVKDLMDQPLLIRHVVLVGIGILLLAVLVSRSGNESAIGATTFELKTRRILDGWLIARPRTKEFLLGNPALFLAFYAAARGWKRWVFPLLVLGAIGQTSLVNTFCHIHTPLFISLFHAINGLWLGALLGWALSIAWNRLQQRSASSLSHEGPPVPGNGRRTAGASG